MITGDKKCLKPEEVFSKNTYEIESYKPTNFIMAWSGGFDSTALLVELLKMLKKKHEKEVEMDCEDFSKLTVITIESANVLNSKGSFAKERQAGIKRLIKPLINPIESCVKWADINFRVDNSITHASGLFLPQIWMSCISMYHDSRYKNHAVISYIASDHSLNHMHDMEQLIKLNVGFTHGLKIEDGFSFLRPSEITVSFPYRYLNKSGILKKLYNENPELINLCFTCQYGTESHNNCICLSCKSIKSAMISFITDRDNTTEMKEFFSKKVDELFGITVSVKEPEVEKDGDVRDKMHFSNNVKANCDDDNEQESNESKEYNL